MRLYELVVILDPRLSTDEMAKSRKTIEEMVGTNAIKKIDDMGIQYLQHNLKDNAQLNKGYVISYAVELDPSTIDTINTELGYNKEIVRNMIFSISKLDDFLVYEDVQEKSQELANNEEWSIKKNLSIFTDRQHDHLFHWKSVPLLEKFMTRFGDIKPRKYTGISVTQQKKIRTAIIRSRTLGFLPFIK